MTAADLSPRADELPAGTVLAGRWRLLRVMARGGMSIVYEAVHRNGRRVAIKVLDSGLVADSQARGRFSREAHLANRVKHPGVVAVLDDDETPDGTPFLVMELLDGETLEERWKQRGKCLPVPEVLDTVAQILDILVAVHHVGIVHRDLKPSNVLLAPAGVKLLDFGIARLLEVRVEQNTLVRTGGLLGTPAFMAPEQARGLWDEVDPRTDLWAVGAMVFSLLTGRLVHETSTPQELLIATATQVPVSLARIAPGLPSGVVDLVARALRLDKAERWPDAATMLREVRALQAGSGDPGTTSRGTRQHGTASSLDFGTLPEGGVWTQNESTHRARWLVPLGLGGAILLCIAALVPLVVPSLGVPRIQASAPGPGVSSTLAPGVVSGVAAVLPALAPVPVAQPEAGAGPATQAIAGGTASAAVPAAASPIATAPSGRSRPAPRISATHAAGADRRPAATPSVVPPEPSVAPEAGPKGRSDFSGGPIDDVLGY